MMTGWQETNLGQYVDFRNGKTSPDRDDAMPFPVYGSNGVIGRANISNANENSIVIGRVGSYCGSLYFSKSKAWVTDNAIIAEAKKGNNPLYFFYLMSGLDLNHLQAGSGQPLINQSILSSIKTAVAPQPEQRAIAAVLGALDDKIELNSRMNATLEAAARALFKSWFVDFDPVKAKMAGRQPFGMDAATAALFPTRLTESELGDIPDGWQPKEIGDLVKVAGGGTPSTTNPDFWADAGHYWATPKDLSNLNSPVLLRTERQISAAGLGAISSGLLPKGTVLMSSRAPIGYIAIAEVPVAINQGFIALICTDALPNLFVWLWLHQNMDVIKGRANGSTFQEISKSNFRPLPVVLPSPKVLAAFTEIASPLWNKIVSNHKENERLIKGRNYLLPKLISGEIRIPDAEKFIGTII